MATMLYPHNRSCILLSLNMHLVCSLITSLTPLSHSPSHPLSHSPSHLLSHPLHPLSLAIFCFSQFTFVYQSLSLWREIMRHMPKLWLLADNDMLNEPYRLCDTGQGYHRVQSCPNVGAEMRRILSHVQHQCGGQWVGLSVIHLGTTIIHASI